MPDSLWTETVKLPAFKTLDKDETTDVLIVGGGMAGLLCAYFLEKSGEQYILCEANRIASGTTSGTTAVISAQHDIFYGDIIKKQGSEAAGLYLEANLDAVNEFRSMSRNIDCDFEEKPSCNYSCSDYKKMSDEVDALASIGFSAELLTEISLPIEIAAAVSFPGQAQFHPLKFVSGICRNLNIREMARIIKIAGGENNTLLAYTDKHCIKAGKIIVTSHFPIINTHGMFFAKLYQMRSYVIALENAAEYDATFVGVDNDGLYFRNYDNLLLVGGGDHRTGTEGGGYDALRRFAKNNYPYASEKYAWAAQDCMSLDGVPYVGRYGSLLPDVFTATGFNEWGMTTSMLSAKMLTSMVQGKNNKYEKLFYPSRSMLSGQLVINVGETIINFLTPKTKRCPHMGCALKWNKAEHSWDCPCHGSRFSEQGKLIDNPAKKGLK